MPRHLVAVTLVAEETVYIELDAEDDESPTDLTTEERQRAIGEADPGPDWEIHDVTHMRRLEPAPAESP
jgi:hypothetical protein